MAPADSGAGPTGRHAGLVGTVTGALRGALIGLLAAAVALGVAELVAAITGPQGSPVVAVGGTAIDLTPIPVKDFAIVHFGSHDKLVLITGILVLLAAFAAVIGIVARRWLAAGHGRSAGVRGAGRRRRADQARGEPSRRGADPGGGRGSDDHTDHSGSYGSLWEDHSPPATGWCE